MDKELIKKAKEAKSAEELLALAKENNIGMTGEQAKAYFAQLHPAAGELADDELDAVAGGGCGGEIKKCPKCGRNLIKAPMGDNYICMKCDVP